MGELTLEQIEETDFGDEKRIEAVYEILRTTKSYTFDSLAEKIVDALNRIDWDRLDRDLTQQIKDALRRITADVDTLEVRQAVAEIGRIINRSTDEYSDLMMRQGDLLRGVVNALRGDPPPLTHWSHHDAADLAEIASAGGKLWIVDTVERLAKLPDYAVVKDANGVRWCKSSLDPICWNSLAGHMGRSNKAMELPVVWWRDGEE